MRKLVLILVLVGWCNSQNIQVDTIYLNGPIDNRINVVFLGDGYQSGEMDKFVTWVTAAWDSMFVNWNGLPYYQDYEKMFNLFAIKSPSSSSGVDHSSYGVNKNTVFDCGFGGNWTTGSCSRSKINQISSDHFPEYDVRIMVFNDDWGLRATGGDPIYIPHDEYIHVIKHELGHNIGDLGDTYVESGRTGTCKEWPNVTATTSRNNIKWNYWIKNSTPIPTNSLYDEEVGLFVGANYLDRNCYRPKYTCLMHDYQGWSQGNMSPFCEVCKEQMILNSYQLVNPIDSIRPDNNNIISFEYNETKAFTVFPALPDLKYNEIIWEVDGQPVDGIHSKTFFLDSIDAGNHEISVTVRDTTSSVLTDLDLLESSLKWDIFVEDEILSVNGGNLISLEYRTKINLLRLSLTRGSQITLKIFDLNGNLAGKFNKQLIAGWNEIEFNKLKPGIYQTVISITNVSTGKNESKQIKILIL